MAVINAFAQDAVDRAEPLTVAAAYAQCRDAALAESAIGAIGLEIESHLVDLDHVADPVPWERVEAIAAAVGRVAPSTAVTVEPGGQHFATRAQARAAVAAWIEDYNTRRRHSACQKLLSAAFEQLLAERGKEAA
jgi:integrase-like protein